MKRAIVVLCLCAASSAFGQGAPSTVSFVARLADGNLPVAGSHDFIFQLFDAPTGGTQLWSEARPGVVVPQDGLLYLDLGSVTPLTSTILNGSPRYLEINLDGVVSDPRVTIESVPYALSSALASRASDADALQGHPTAYFQRAVGTPCAAGNYVQGVAADGTLSCAPDLNTMYAAGNGLLLTAGTFSIDPTRTQARVTGMCATGAIETVNADGSVTCLTAGTGLLFSAGQFLADFGKVQAAIGPACGGNQLLQNVNAAGATTCITANTGLAVSAGNLNVDTTTVQARVTGTCPAGSQIQSIDAAGNVTCGGASVATVTTAGSQTTNSNAYTGLAGGPQVTVTVPASKTVLVTVTAQISPNTGNMAFMSFTGCGVASSDANSVAYDGGTLQASATYLVTCTNSGSQTFTAQYHSSGGRTAAFSNRGIIVQGVP